MGRLSVCQYLGEILFKYYLLLTHVLQPPLGEFTGQLGVLKRTKPPTHQTQAGGACGERSPEVPPRSPVDLSTLNMIMFDCGVPRLLTEKLLFI